MRDIKFRAWDENFKYMNYKVLVGMWGDNVLDDINYTACLMWIEPKNVNYKCEPHWGHFEPYHKEISLMQYTGRKDMNNKEVYEGDILSRDGHWMQRVEFDNGAFKLKDVDPVRYFNNCTDICLAEYPLSNWEVIGNIFENKELLES